MNTGKQYLEVYTDGGCHGNPGPGGWAFVIEPADSVVHGNVVHGSGAEAHTTNNRMELRAVIEALKKARELAAVEGDDIDRRVALFTDSQYVRGGITEWMARWVRNGWKTSAGKPVKNQDLWQELSRQTEGLTITWHWVKGHAGNPQNELCDSLVQDAIAALRAG